MTLDEAIKHCEEVSNRERELYKMCPENCDGSSDCRELKHGKDRGCIKCAEEHEQLAKWLKELKATRHTISLFIHAFNEWIKKGRQNEESDK